MLADFARGLEAAARAETAAIAPVDRGGPLALSFAQQRLWFLEQLGGMGAAYHIPMRLRLRGALDRGALVRALDRIVARHEALRTTFPTVDGEPVQRIAPVGESGFRLVEHDLHAAPDAEDALRRLVADEAGAPFDLAHGPLIRGRLVRMAADDHVLLSPCTTSSPTGGAWGCCTRELGALYTAFARGEPIRSRRCRCSTPTTRRGTAAGWRARSCSGRRTTGARRSRARRSCWSFRRTIHARRGRTSRARR